jgi:hypothetical protein
VSRYHPGRMATRAAEATVGKPQSPLERGDSRGRSHSREAAISSWIWSCKYYDIILLAIWYAHAFRVICTYILTEAVISYMSLLYLQRARVFLNMILHLVLLTAVCQKKRYVLIRFSLHACVLFKYMCIYGYSVLHILFVYMSVFHFWTCFKRWAFWSENMLMS